MSNWWADKLSGAKPVQPPSTPPTTMYPRQVVYVPPAAPQAYQQPQPPQYPQPYQQPVQHGAQNLLDPRRAPTDQIPMGEAIHLWKGGEAHRKEGGLSCPECGSPSSYTTRAKGSIAGKPPAPRCFECGYTGLYTQADQANWAV